MMYKHFVRGQNWVTPQKISTFLITEMYEKSITLKHVKWMQLFYPFEKKMLRFYRPKINLEKKMAINFDNILSKFH